MVLPAGILDQRPGLPPKAVLHAPLLDLYVLAYRTTYLTRRGEITETAVLEWICPSGGEAHGYRALLIPDRYGRAPRARVYDESDCGFARVAVPVAETLALLDRKPESA